MVFHPSANQIWNGFLLTLEACHIPSILLTLCPGEVAKTSNLFCDYYYFCPRPKDTMIPFWKFPKVQNICIIYCQQLWGWISCCKTGPPMQDACKGGIWLRVLWEWENNPSIEKSYFAPGCDSRVNSKLIWGGFKEGGAHLLTQSTFPVLARLCPGGVQFKKLHL